MVALGSLVDQTVAGGEATPMAWAVTVGPRLVPRIRVPRAARFLPEVGERLWGTGLLPEGAWAGARRESGSQRCVRAEGAPMVRQRARASLNRLDGDGVGKQDRVVAGTDVGVDVRGDPRCRIRQAWQFLAV